MQRAEANNYYPHLIASALGVDGSTIAMTNLTFIAGVDLSNHVPIIAIVRFVSGTLGLCTISVNVNGFGITALTALGDIVAARPNMAIDCASQDKAISNDPSDFIECSVTTGSVAASTFDIFVYGTQFN